VISVTQELAIAGNITTILETQTNDSKDGKIYSRATNKLSDINLHLS